MKFLNKLFPTSFAKIARASILAIGILLFFSNNLLADQAMLEQENVQQFITEFSGQYGIDPQQLAAIFVQVEARKAVIHHITHPAEAMTWDRYKKLFITPTKIKNGVKFWHEHQAMLAKAEQEYHVPAAIIVATIGIESNYGHNQGKFRVIDALANLAFNYDQPKRSKFFRYELNEFLIMTLVEHPQDPMAVLGSYAGAIGMVQFMPNNYRQLAVDYSNNGSIDLSTDPDDALGSVANYYHHAGWQWQQPVASYALINAHTLKLNENHTYSRQELTQNGYINSQTWPDTITHAKLIDLPLSNQHGHQFWLAYPNFSVIEKYNPSPLYAMAVWRLSLAIEEAYQKAYNPAS